jgi:hypothetical protein
MTFPDCPKLKVSTEWQFLDGHHIDRDRLVEMSKGAKDLGLRFSEQEFQHLTGCVQCGRLLSALLREGRRRRRPLDS